MSCCCRASRQQQSSSERSLQAHWQGAVQRGCLGGDPGSATASSKAAVSAACRHIGRVLCSGAHKLGVWATWRCEQTAAELYIAQTAVALQRCFGGRRPGPCSSQQQSSTGSCMRNDELLSSSKSRRAACSAACQTTAVISLTAPGCHGRVMSGAWSCHVRSGGTLNTWRSGDDGRTVAERLQVRF
jgi:hypothetical protein